MEIAAFFQGLLGASSLFFGASVGVLWQPNKDRSNSKSASY